MLKNIDYDLILDIMGWGLVNLITIWMIITYFRDRRENERRFGKGWRKKLKNRGY